MSRWFFTVILVMTTSVRAVQADEPADAPVSTPQAFAAPTAPSEVVITGYWENDGGPLKRNHLTDRHYTNGFGFSLAHQPPWAGAVTELIPFGQAYDPQDARAGYLVAQQMFTPADFDLPTLVADDRPYAGYLFAGVFVQRANQHTVDHFQLDLGVVGPSSQAGALQRSIHKIIGEPKPAGWDHQLGDEATVQFHLRKKWRLDLASVKLNDIDAPLAVQMLPQVGASVGTVYRNLEAGATLRAGFNLPNDFGPGRLEDVAAYGPSDDAVHSGLSLYGFIRAAARYVEHNLFLDGSTHRDSHSVDARPGVGEWQLGIAGQYRVQNLTFEMTYSQTFRSDEFYGQDGGDALGALTLAAHLWF